MRDVLLASRLCRETGGQRNATRPNSLGIRLLAIDFPETSDGYITSVPKDESLSAIKGRSHNRALSLAYLWTTNSA